MKAREAASLIHSSRIDWERPQSWCDLGAGSGTFTKALAQLLAPGSAIYAVDLDPRALQKIPDRHDGVEIRKVVGDLRDPRLDLPPVDGILIANTLHFIPEQQAFLNKLLTLTNRLLVVEYERARPHRWGPHPVPWEKLRQLCEAAGVERIEKLATLPSLYGGHMYSALVVRSGPHS